ncbi:DUF4917 family protein [Agrobacterium vitis]|uniref:DUF4917 family protein n=1 Tax=Agrobacterium vitis TaxID=373 RepID=UPI0012E952F5|nr:DUF4917 family protein [Agrobacterium vitis]MVA17516.1 DUF4917 family protein [Agrobacterium vitis]
MTAFNTYDEAVNQAIGQKNLLVGNGLSIAFSDNFKYAKLFDAANFEDNNPKIAAIFKALNTKDFETVAGAILIARNISHELGNDDFAKELDQKIEELKNNLIEAVKNTHPEDKNCVTDDQCKNIQKFLSSFFEDEGCVYSLNYDALLYWALLRWFTNSPTKGKFADGFGAPDNGSVHFLGDMCPKPVNFLFPHGALFLFEENGDVLKPQAAIKEKKLLEIITNNMEQGSFPLFVSEGSHSQKLKAIRKSFYLNYAFEKIGTAKENFFIFGHSMDLASDGHIIEKIFRNEEIKNIYASFNSSRDAIEGKLLQLRAHVNRDDSNLKLHTYPASTVLCW